MTTEPSLWGFIANAGLVVKLVMLILFCASIASWTIIIQRSLLFKTCKTEIKNFLNRFWSGIALSELFINSNENDNPPGIDAIFQAGFEEYERLREQHNIKPEAIIDGVDRAMRIATQQELAELEKNISFLATVGSTSPYVGLFGTVWGIMTSFSALGAVQQATISMVAPGISEALIATAIGLFAAIPAVIAYNRLSNSLEYINNQYITFQEEFLSIVQREVYS